MNIRRSIQIGAVLAGLAILFVAAEIPLSAQERPAGDPQRRTFNPADAQRGSAGDMSGPTTRPAQGFFGRGGRGGPGGFGGPGMRENRKILKQFDKNNDGWLNTEERQAARDFLRKERESGQGQRGFGFFGGPNQGPGAPAGPGIPPGADRPRDGAAETGPATRPAGDRFNGPPAPQDGRGGRGQRGFFGPGGGPGGPGGPGGFGGPFGRRNQDPAKPGPKVSPQDVKNFPQAGLYDPTVLRTIFLDFEEKDWENELTEFHGTDVEVAATLTVDGRKYTNVGVRFRGTSSYMMVPAGYKRSMNLSMDLADKKQKLYGYKTLNLLNANGDPTFLRAALYSQIARTYIPTPRVNIVKLVVNGESWGIYVNSQQFNKEMVAEAFGTTKGARWKTPGSPGGRAGLNYLGENIDDYRRLYQIKSGDDEKSWKKLIALCRTLSQTPTDQLEGALSPLLNIDGALWFLALENALVNSDGYWTRASDYSLYLDARGKFHILPYDINEAFSNEGGGPGPGMGRGGGMFGGGRGPGGMQLSPLVAVNDQSKPLLSRLLAVPSLRARYLQHVRTIAQDWLNWQKLQPIVQQYAALIEKEVEADTKKLASFEEFREGVGLADAAANPQDRRRHVSLKQFVDERGKFLLTCPEIRSLEPAQQALKTEEPAQIH